MSINSNKIFHGSKHVLTAPFGQVRKNNRIHLGTDYGTYGQNSIQFCPRDGGKVVRVVNKESIGNERGLFVDIRWRSIDRGLILQHLQEIKVNIGDTLTTNTPIGTTGMTGKNSSGQRVSTGIHAHIELYEISTGKRLNYDTWDMEEDMTKEETIALVNEIVNKKDSTPTEWAKEDWEWGIKNKLTDGSSPKAYIKRQEVIALLHRLYKLIMKVLKNEE